MKKTVTVVGAGPAGLMAAEVLAKAGLSVTVLDHKSSPARKFLLAGRGGLNLTHSEPLDKFLARYGEARNYLEPMIRAFPPDALVAWANELGQETFTGSSGRIFPKSMKTSPLLRAWLQRLAGQGVTFQFNAQWQGFDGTPKVLALGGASWPHLGSDGGWVPLFRQAGITVDDLQPANCRVIVPWTAHFTERFAGQPLKNLELRYGAAEAKGEVIISKQGLEGGAIYALSRYIRDEPGKPLIFDLKPTLSGDAIAQRLSKPRGAMSQANFLRKAVGLTPAAIALLHETKTPLTAEGIKAVKLMPQGLAGIARAISTAGGVAREELDANGQLKKQPLCYCVGEMVSWEAPTGGYLLQACFSSAVAAACDLAVRLAPSTP
ncbi:NAD(P)/FAD-dependent oxidoreductase [Aestuariivirga litoralis]|uniref:NAD(P)/FAD-dependent oxidoreductase n=1 Tax=Aestuariivirga litoralis TaxID=2650924 RepID=UPI0018C7A9AA|nr:TIGR03862 family flavoprotein [Aestuariivirga litoralis]MBG1231884.1 TIGR03862 family flavoprotein [Aestuariivirga litoralis]